MQDERRRPGDDESGAAVSQSSGGDLKLTSTVIPRPGNGPPARRRCRHLRERFCWQCVREGRRVSAELDAVAGRERHVARPESYALSDDALRREANRLHAAGWPVDEVSAVLDVQPRDGAR